MTIKLEANDFIKILKEEKLTPDKCPEKITFDMLKKELKPEGKYENNEENKLTLWKCFYMTSFSSNEFGFNFEEKGIGDKKIPWYKVI